MSAPTPTHVSMDLRAGGAYTDEQARAYEGKTVTVRMTVGYARSTKDGDLWLVGPVEAVDE